jgi:hypothetical protein
MVQEGSESAPAARETINLKRLCLCSLLAFSFGRIHADVCTNPGWGWHRIANKSISGFLGAKRQPARRPECLGCATHASPGASG